MPPPIPASPGTTSSQYYGYIGNNPTNASVIKSTSYTSSFGTTYQVVDAGCSQAGFPENETLKLVEDSMNQYVTPIEFTCTSVGGKGTLTCTNPNNSFCHNINCQIIEKCDDKCPNGAWSTSNLQYKVFNNDQEWHFHKCSDDHNCIPCDPAVDTNCVSGACEDASASACNSCGPNNECSNHGNCWKHNTCICDSPWYGMYCDQIDYSVHCSDYMNTGYTSTQKFRQLGIEGSVNNGGAWTPRSPGLYTTPAISGADGMTCPAGCNLQTQAGSFCAKQTWAGDNVAADCVEQSASESGCTSRDYCIWTPGAPCELPEDNWCSFIAEGGQTCSCVWEPVTCPAEPAEPAAPGAPAVPADQPGIDNMCTSGDGGQSLIYEPGLTPPPPGSGTCIKQAWAGNNVAADCIAQNNNSNECTARDYCIWNQQQTGVFTVPCPDQAGGCMLADDACSQWNGVGPAYIAGCGAMTGQNGSKLCITRTGAGVVIDHQPSGDKDLGKKIEIDIRDDASDTVVQGCTAVAPACTASCPADLTDPTSPSFIETKSYTDFNTGRPDADMTKWNFQIGKYACDPGVESVTSPTILECPGGSYPQPANPANQSDVTACNVNTTCVENCNQYVTCSTGTHCIGENNHFPSSGDPFCKYKCVDTAKFTNCDPNVAGSEIPMCADNFLLTTCGTGAGGKTYCKPANYTSTSVACSKVTNIDGSDNDPCWDTATRHDKTACAAAKGPSLGIPATKSSRCKWAAKPDYKEPLPITQPNSPYWGNNENNYVSSWGAPDLDTVCKSNYGESSWAVPNAGGETPVFADGVGYSCTDLGLSERTGPTLAHTSSVKCYAPLGSKSGMPIAYQKGIECTPGEVAPTPIVCDYPMAAGPVADPYVCPVGPNPTEPCTDWKSVMDGYGSWINVCNNCDEACHTRGCDGAPTQPEVVWPAECKCNHWPPQQSELPESSAETAGTGWTGPCPQVAPAWSYGSCGLWLKDTACDQGGSGALFSNKLFDTDADAQVECNNSCAAQSLTDKSICWLTGPSKTGQENTYTCSYTTNCDNGMVNGGSAPWAVGSWLSTCGNNITWHEGSGPGSYTEKSGYCTSAQYPSGMPALSGYDYNIPEADAENQCYAYGAGCTGYTCCETCGGTPSKNGLCKLLGGPIENGSTAAGYTCHQKN